FPDDVKCVVIVRRTAIREGNSILPCACHHAGRCLIPVACPGVSCDLPGYCGRQREERQPGLQTRPGSCGWYAHINLSRQPLAGRDNASFPAHLRVSRAIPPADNRPATRENSWHRPAVLYAETR